MIIYEPVEYFKISRRQLEGLCEKILKILPERILFDGKEFGSLEEYKCASLAEVYKNAGNTLDDLDANQWSELEPVVFDFIIRAIKHVSVYLTYVDTQQVDIGPIVKEMSAREDIQIKD